MSGGFWFTISIPSEEYERNLNNIKLEKDFKDIEDNLISDGIEDKKEGDEEEDEEEKKDDGNISSSVEDLKKQKPRKSTVMFMDNASEYSEERESFHEIDLNGETLVKRLRDALEILGIDDAIWIASEDKNYYHVYFPCEPGVRCDYVLDTLAEREIGMKAKSSLGIIPCAVFYRDVETEVKTPIYEDEEDSEDAGGTKAKSDIKKSLKEGIRNMQRQFLKSVTARLTVAQVVEGVRANAMLTFDFMMFTVLASMIAALGLMENSSVVLVASMLISPLMGPILAGTFGAVIQDKSLRNLGIKTEIVGLVLCLLFGFVFGLICANFSSKWGQGDWPTTEMASRGQGRSLWVGALIALPSGAGVALSVLGGNAGSLVGVAISASLLPPAVNAGLLWAVSAVKVQRSMTEFPILFKKDNVSRMIKPSLIPPEGYHVEYFNTMEKECAVLGVVSLLLTLVNILCIFLMAVLVLKIKEVAPKTAAPQTSRFWKEDLKIARDYNKTISKSEGRELGKEFLDEWANLSGFDSTDLRPRISQYNALRNIVNDVELDPVYQTVMRSMPSRPLSQRLSTIPERDKRSTWDPEMGADPTYAMTVAASNLRRHTYLSFENEEKPKFKPIKLENGLSSKTVIDVATDPELRGIQLRRSQPSRNNRFSELLRQSLWPSSSAPRFRVTPVEEGQSQDSRQRPGSTVNIQRESSC
ncbi:uncharacterized protein [Centruroides vittatus]|uniref:uncharacterized protein n=1 Tax=Centruroides vittatus TaxID=120091 RepID=UPI00351000F8